MVEYRFQDHPSRWLRPVLVTLFLGGSVLAALSPKLRQLRSLWFTAAVLYVLYRWIDRKLSRPSTGRDDAQRH